MTRLHSVMAIKVFYHLRIFSVLTDRLKYMMLSMKNKHNYTFMSSLILIS